MALSPSLASAEETFKLGIVTFLSGPAAESFGVPAHKAGQFIVDDVDPVSLDHADCHAVRDQNEERLFGRLACPARVRFPMLAGKQSNIDAVACPAVRGVNAPRAAGGFLGNWILAQA